MISILLPTFNRADIMGRCVRSIQQQSYRDWELIILDDGSDDATKAVGLQMAKADQRIRYHWNEQRLGLPANRNVGLRLATGEFIFFIEDDMVLRPDCVGTLMETYRRETNRGIRVGAVAPRLVDPTNGGQAGSWKANVPCVVNRFTGVIYSNFSMVPRQTVVIPNAHACCFYPRAVFDQVGGYDADRYTGNFLYEDADLNHRLRKSNYHIIFQPQAVMDHIRVGSGGCRTGRWRYGFYFVRNHLRFVRKHYGLRTLYMIPCFLAFVTVTGLKRLRAGGL